jgi:HD superfamily phosphohydrolase
MPLSSLPELVAFESHGAGVRVPPGITVPLTDRVRRLLDTSEMRRLARVSQLGLVALVYPGAVHSRLEHSLGVYRLALAFLARLRHDPRFAALVGEDDAAAFVVAALVHDIGHWPFCHAIEDVGLASFPRHESRVLPALARGEPAAVLAEDFCLRPERIASLITGTATDPAGKILHSLLSGPVDIDKMDYLGRDSLHAGVPYGRHFDEERLLASLCLDRDAAALAITDKGRTAAEMLVFARYVMFSEVYWHHAVRSATAMLQRAIWLLDGRIAPPQLIQTDDPGFVTAVLEAAAGTAAAPLVEGLFGPHRRLFKRVVSFDALRHRELHAALAGRDYADKVAIATRLAAAIALRTGTDIAPDDLLVDAPPAEREVEFRLNVRESARRLRPAAAGHELDDAPDWLPLEQLSPVVRSLAHEQFDDIVKRVRLFAPVHKAKTIAGCPALEELILVAAGQPR